MSGTLSDRRVRSQETVINHHGKAKAFPAVGHPPPPHVPGITVSGLLVV